MMCRRGQHRYHLLEHLGVSLLARIGVSISLLSLRLPAAGSFVEFLGEQVVSSHWHLDTD